MDFFVYSRQMIEAVDPHEVGHLIISIRTPGNPKEVRLRTNEHTRGVLHMVFHDIDSYPPDVEKIMFEEEPELQKSLFTEAMGSEILSFVTKHLSAKDKPVERIIVNCDAGISRSPAVAAAICKTVCGEDDDWFFKRFHPNRRVYRCILNAYGNATTSS